MLPIIAASVFVLLLVVAVFVLFNIFFKKKKKLLLEQENMKLVYEQTIVRARMEVQEQAFSQISQEIHDNIGQILSLARLQINTLGLEEEKTAPTDELLGRAIKDLRQLSHNLNTTRILEGGFTHAAKQLLTHLQNTRQFNTSFRDQGVDTSLPEEKTIILFRIFQEVINNIIHHAKATAIDVQINKTEKGFEVSVSDNGQGFPNEPSEDPGLGISNMKYRAGLIGARLNINSSAGKGTEVVISIQKNSYES